MTVATGARRGESPPPPPKAGMEKQHGGASVVFSFGALVAAYLFLNSSLNLLNKYALGHFGFRFPFLLTSSHMAFCFLALAPIAMREPWENHLATLQKQWKGLVVIGVALSLNISLNNAYNLVHSLMIKRTSAVTTTVLGEAKIIGLLVLSALLLGEARELTATMTAGVLIATTGFVWYSQTQIVKARGAAQPLAPVPSSASMRSSSSVRMLKILEEGRDPRADKAAEAD